MTTLITGGAGFIGSNIADALLASGQPVHIYDALQRPGVERNLAWLQSRHGNRVQATVADIRDQDRLAHAARAAASVIHLAAQVAVTTSLVDPLADFETNVAATVRLLEASRVHRPRFLFASTNKVYGDLGDLAFAVRDDAYAPLDADIAAHGIDESRSLDFHTPYGCSKGAADQYVLDYARSYGVPATVFRMSCVYGQRQMGTEDQGWVAHFLIRALTGEPITMFGDGRQVRDVLDVSDVVAAYMRALGSPDTAGRAFNLGGGPRNAVSLRQLLAYMEGLLGRAPATTYEDWRAGDQRWFVADARAARAALGLDAFRGWKEGIAALAEWLRAERAPSPSLPSVAFPSPGSGEGGREARSTLPPAGGGICGAQRSEGEGARAPVEALS